MCHAYELHVVVIEPFGVALVQFGFPSRLLLVRLHQVHYPLSLVLAFTVVRRVAYHHHHRRVALYAVGGVGLVAEPLGE